MNAIQTLVSAAEKLVDRPVATSEAEAEHWLNNPALYMAARTRHVRSLPSSAKLLAQEALAIWQEREAKYLRAIDRTRQEFLNAAKCDIEGLAPPTTGKPALEALRRDMDARWYGEQNASGQVVQNIDWVNAFVWILPAADTNNASTYRTAGKVMAAIMFYEAKLKSPESMDRFRKLWLRAGDV